MKVQQDICVHNRFDIEVRDKNTGELKQTAVGFNVITDKYFEAMLYAYQRYEHKLLQYIAFGRGTGTPAASDTALFSKIDDVSADTIETVYAYPTSHITKQIILDADHYNGETITEVGFWGYYYRSSSSSTDILATHAMLQDSEGRQIAISKTDTDVVYIKATFYCTYTPGGFGNNGIYPTAANNLLVKWIFSEDIRDDSATFALRAWHHPLAYSSKLNSYYTFTKNYKMYSYSSSSHGGIGYPDLDAKTMTLEAASILSDEGGTQSMRTIGYPGIGAFVFPDASVMDRYSIQNKTIATGDGVTTDFSLGSPYIKRGTVHIYVNDAEQTENTDYTIDYDSNCTDNYGNYHTANMTLIYDREHVKFGDEESRTKADSTYYDPLCMSKAYGTTNVLPKYCSVSQANPIWIDFSETKVCNRLKFGSEYPPEGKEDLLVIEYSNDNTNWTALSYTRNGTAYSFTDTTARYWRVYISGYTWSYYFNESSSTLDGVESIRATFFLGRTAPALHFMTAPAQDSIITATYDIEVPYKTSNNLMRLTVVISLNRD